MNIPKYPYPGYEADQAARNALACLECPTPAPCQIACAHGVDIPKVMRWAGLAACEEFSLSRWLLTDEEVEDALLTDEEVEGARVADQIFSCYN